MTYTMEQLARAASGACFYVTPDGLWLRMQYVDLDVGTFCAMDEESGEDYTISLAELLEEDEAPEFYHLVRTQVGNLTLADTNEVIEP